MLIEPEIYNRSRTGLVHFLRFHAMANSEIYEKS